MPPEWLTWSGRPDSSLTASEGRSSDASTATVPPIRRTFTSVTSSNSSAVGASTVQRVIRGPPGRHIHQLRPRYVVLRQSQDVSRLRGECSPGLPRRWERGSPGREGTHPFGISCWFLEANRQGQK